MNRTWMLGSAVALYLLAAVTPPRPALAQGAPAPQYKVLAITTGGAPTTAADATLKIRDWAATGWAPISIAAGDMFTDSLKEGTTQAVSKEFDLYILLTCTPAPQKTCARLTPP